MSTTLELENNKEESFDVKGTITEELAIETSVMHNIGSVTKGLGTGKAIFLIFRSLVGIGILTMPHQINEFGIVASLIFYPLIAAMVLYALDCMVRTANDLEYYG